MKKKTKKSTPKTNLFFELDGNVFIVEKTKKGKIVSKQEIPAETVLKCIIHVLDEALRLYDKND